MRPSDQLDELVEFSYRGVPTVTVADIVDGMDKVYARYRRPRLAHFSFSPYARTPVHDLPHDGVGVVALHVKDWESALREFRRELPPEMNLVSLYGIAVEQW